MKPVCMVLGAGAERAQSVRDVPERLARAIIEIPSRDKRGTTIQRRDFFDFNDLD